MPHFGRLVHRLLDAGPAATDDDLLARFAADRDERSFETLVRRHGPMVLGVCRRVLRHHQDAEDAFQATFLVLARRAGAVGGRGGIANWLYGVAYRTALRARRLARVRGVREARAAAARPLAQLPGDPGPGSDDLAVVERELSRLPVAYRAAVVACDLEGLSRREAAAQLGLTEGTLSSRLARGRAHLARRVARHGVAVPAVGLCAAGGSCAVGADLVVVTVRMGTLVAAGGVVSAQVAALMEGSVMPVFGARLKGLAAVAVIAGSVGVAAAAGWYGNAGTSGGPPRGAEPLEVPERTSGRDRPRAPEAKPEPQNGDAPKLRAGVTKADLEGLLRQRLESIQMLKQDLMELSERSRRLQNALVVEESRYAELVAAFGAARSVPAPPGGPVPNVSPRPDTELSIETYNLSGLVTSSAAGDSLAQFLRATVQPADWGSGTGIEYVGRFNVLVVRHTGEVRTKIRLRLEQLKALFEK